MVTDGSGQALPGVIIIPTVMGVTDLEIGFARDLVGHGYNALVADLFGKKFHGAARDVMFGEMNRLGSDRASLRERLLSVLELTRGQPDIDSDRIAVMGFCFGGKCALIWRGPEATSPGSRASTACSTRPGLPPEKIKAKIVAYHGWDDPMVPPDAVVALAKELTEAGCDWQIHAYGHTGHGFTDPKPPNCRSTASFMFATPRAGRSLHLSVPRRAVWVTAFVALPGGERRPGIC